MFLLFIKNNAAAATIIAHPPTVKIVVPIPPVSGKAPTSVSLISASAVNSAVALSPVIVKVALELVSLIEYPSGAVTSLN